MKPLFVFGFVIVCHFFCNPVASFKLTRSRDSFHRFLVKRMSQYEGYQDSSHCTIITERLSLNRLHMISKILLFKGSTTPFFVRGGVETRHCTMCFLVSLPKTKAKFDADEHVI